MGFLLRKAKTWVYGCSEMCSCVFLATLHPTGDGEGVELVTGLPSEWRKPGREPALGVGESEARIETGEKQRSVRVSSESLSLPTGKPDTMTFPLHSAEPLPGPCGALWIICIHPRNEQPPCLLHNKAVDTHKYLGAGEWGMTEFGRSITLGAWRSYQLFKQHFALAQIVNHFGLVFFFLFFPFNF